MNIGMIGCGNMGGALARAITQSLHYKNDHLSLADAFPEKATALAAELSADTADNITIAEFSDFIFLGIKPQMMAGMLAEIAPVLAARAGRQERFVLVSMAAGLSVEKISSMAQGDYPVIRIMPNTPAQVGQGMILYTANVKVSAHEEASFVRIMENAGVLDKLPEHLIDAGSAVSGCGPAFVCLFLEALADGGVACGLPRDKAMLYAAQTLKGTAELVMTSHQHPGALKDAVCSPGGSTIAGVQALEESAFRAAAMKAVAAAYKRTVELGK
ncbi:MAG: pyrroline-5-carboxylate reductase [Clostridia bacterium]|nr:pyrroline-5-carboxylate reductase [Clostridia bacterium]